MDRKTVENVFYDFTRALMTMTVCGCIYILRAVVLMAENPAAAVRLYYSFPEMIEHIVAAVLFYLIFGILYNKAVLED